MSKLTDAIYNIKSCEKQACTAFLEIGRILYEVQNNHCYKEKYASFTAFLEGERFSFSRQHAYSLIRLYESVKSILQTERLNLESLGLTKILTLINQGEELSPERIEKAKSQSVSEIKESKTNKPSSQAITALVSGFRKELAKIQKPDAGLKQELQRLKDLIEKLLA